MAQHITTRRAVTQAWDSYSALVKAVSRDPIVAADPSQQEALSRAHARWSEAFIAWDGR